MIFYHLNNCSYVQNNTGLTKCQPLKSMKFEISEFGVSIPVWLTFDSLSIDFGEMAVIIILLPVAVV